MIIDKNSLRLYQDYKIKLTDSLLIKLEDAIKDKKELLINIRASSLAFKNGNSTIYRHDTIKNNIQSFIYPSPKPIIERHKPKTSPRYGSIVAADYKLTKFYDELSKAGVGLEGLDTDGYMALCKESILPLQKLDRFYGGLAYVEVIGKLTNQDAIKKVLKDEWAEVSIGADPKRLICSECSQDQVSKICDHYGTGFNNIFMLAEELEYEELSFIPRAKAKPADPRARITKIHDGIELLDSQIDVLDYDEFYNITKNKTIVCVNNICTICDQEEEMARRKEGEKVISISYKEEFSTDKLKELKLNDEQVSDEVIETLELQDELQDDQFAIIQKTDEGLKRRFPLHDETNVKLALQLIDKAEDLTEAETVKAKKTINKTAKKLGIECSCKDEVKVEGESEETNEVTKTIESLTDELITLLKEVDETKLQDEENKPKPISFIMNSLSSLASSLKWAGEDLKGSIDYYLKSLGQEVLDKCMADELRDSKQTLTDELAEAKEEITLLDEQNRELNYQIRISLVDEIISYKTIEQDKIEDERKRLSKLSYETLKEVATELKNSSTNSDTRVNNKKDKNISTVKDPTLADEQGAELEDDKENKGKLKDEEEAPKLTEKQLAEAIAAMFRKY